MEKNCSMPLHYTFSVNNSCPCLIAPVWPICWVTMVTNLQPDSCDVTNSSVQLKESKIQMANSLLGFFLNIYFHTSAYILDQILTYTLQNDTFYLKLTYAWAENTQQIQQQPLSFDASCLATAAHTHIYMYLQNRKHSLSLFYIPSQLQSINTQNYKWKQNYWCKISLVF